MDCRTISERLEAFLDGRLDAGESEAIRAHLLSCTECGAALPIPVPGQGGNRPEPPPGLAEAILQRTSGATCPGARDRLADHADGTLPAVDADLVRLHLGDCGDCRALLRVLERLAVDLPALAHLDPGERFLDDVVAATASRRRHGWAARMSAGWSGLVRRPRFAMEGAFVATIAIVLAFGNPTVPLAAISRQVRGLVEGGTGEVIGQPMNGIQDELASGVDELKTRWEELESKADAASRGIRQDLTRRATGSRRKITEWLGTIRQSLASEDVNEPAGPEAGETAGEQGEGNNERK